MEGDAALITVAGLIDERFSGFGEVGKAKTAVIDVSGLARMTSFGVRQWLKGMEGLQKSIQDLYLLGCPMLFVDQLNMVLNFAGSAKVLTVVAPYTCNACSTETGEIVDVVAERTNLTSQPPEKKCARCGGKLELDETAESYFAFASKYGATNVDPAAAQLLASHGLYTSPTLVTQKPPRIIKLVHGSVTYFRVIGMIGSLFRARPFIVGAEGEVVIDLAEVTRFDVLGIGEWRRLFKTLAGQVTSVTLVDVGASLLTTAGDTFTLARNIAVASLLAPYECRECGRTSEESENLTSLRWPPAFEDRVCPTCGGATQCKLSPELLSPLQKASTQPPPASIKVVELRNELLSRALTGASVARSTGPGVGSSDVVLGKYKIVRRLSGGGMADVFLAKQIGIVEKPVALKRIQNKLLQDRHQAIELFLNEAKIVARLTHPNIVQVLDVGQAGGALYLAMEYVHGRDLRDVIKVFQKTTGRMPLAEACYIAREIALALDHAYWSTDMGGKQLSVVHRDVSPHNVILGFDGTVKLLDFGVAVSAITETTEKLLVGKWTYMAPETAISSVADHRSDLFSLGVVMYLLCCGSAPFLGTTPKEIVRKIRTGAYTPVKQIAPTVPVRLANLIARLLASEPGLRPQRGNDVVIELNEIMREYGLDSSARRIAELLSELFGDATTRASTSDVVHVVREDVGPEDDTRVVTSPGVDPSLTPSAETDHRSHIDTSMSVSFKGLTASITSTGPRPTGTIPTAVQLTPGTKPRPSNIAIVKVLLVLANLVLAAVLIYLLLSRR